MDRWHLMIEIMEFSERIRGATSVRHARYFMLVGILISGAWAQNAPCGAQFDGDSGEVFSPNYPDRYPASSNCKYTITRSSRGDTRLQFLVFQMSSRSCLRNKLEIYEGTSISPATVVREYCHQSSLPQGDTVIIPGHIVTLVFTTDRVTSGTGFRLRYSSAAETCEALGGLCINTWCEKSSNDFCSNGQECCWEHTYYRPNCGGLYFERSGVLNSPNYPERYPNNQDCDYVFVRLNSTVAASLNIAKMEESLECAVDYVQFFDGPGKDFPSLTERLCDDQVHSVVSTGPYLGMVFRSDGNLGYTGFTLSWGAPECYFFGGRCTTGSCWNWRRDLECADGGSCCLDSCDLSYFKICVNGQCVPRASNCSSDFTPLPGGIRCPSNGHVCPDGSCVGERITCECVTHSANFQKYCWDGRCLSSGRECPCNQSHPNRCDDQDGCFADTHYCDGKVQCPDGSDEADHTCSSTGGDPDLTAILVPIFVVGSCVLFSILCCCCRKRDPPIPQRPVEILSANVSVHNGRLSTTGHPVLLSVNSMDNGPPPSYLQPTAPPSYGEYESYSTPFPLDETPESPCIYTPSDDDNPMSEAPPPAYESVAHISNPSYMATVAADSSQSTPTVGGVQQEGEAIYV